MMHSVTSDINVSYMGSVTINTFVTKNPAVAKEGRLYVGDDIYAI